jgi:thiosulfate reductase/polysulfide reductase chain A
LVKVEDGIVKQIRGNPAGGQYSKVCVKGASGYLLQYSPDRLLYPMKRAGERGENKWTRITWDEALDTITAKLKELQDRGEQHKLTGNFFPHSVTDPKFRFLDAYGGFINTALPH